MQSRGRPGFSWQCPLAVPPCSARQLVGSGIDGMDGLAAGGSTWFCPMIVFQPFLDARCCVRVNFDFDKHAYVPWSNHSFFSKEGQPFTMANGVCVFFGGALFRWVERTPIGSHTFVWALQHTKPQVSMMSWTKCLGLKHRERRKQLTFGRPTNAGRCDLKRQLVWERLVLRSATLGHHDAAPRRSWDRFPG